MHRLSRAGKARHNRMLYRAIKLYAPLAQELTLIETEDKNNATIAVALFLKSSHEKEQSKTSCGIRWIASKR